MWGKWGRVNGEYYMLHVFAIESSAVPEQADVVISQDPLDSRGMK